MRGGIPEHVLTELRERASIVEVVSASVALRRQGARHVGLCPFHAEKTPSFTVSEDRGLFHCFGCGAGGDVFTFLMRMENLPFLDVVERLARRFGVVIPERSDTSPDHRVREDLFRLNDQAARFFQRYLWESGEAHAARAYVDERGISRATAERYVLGYAPAGGDALVGRLRQAGHALEPAVRLGLIGESPARGGHYDRFRARLMFPITDLTGRVVGFGSRSVPDTPSASAGLPKYLNSPETPLYRKGAHLYGLARARGAIHAADRALVVEGYFDVLALAEAGIEHAVASLGTALTLDQLRILKRHTRNIVAFFDGDAAGQKAAEKSLPIFFEAGLWGHAAFLPPGDDPDSFVRREGRERVEALLDTAMPLLDFYLDRAVRPTSSPAERAVVAQQVAQWLEHIADPFEYDITARRAAERLGLGEDVLRRRPPRARPVGLRPTITGLAPDAEELLVTLMLGDLARAQRVDEAGGAALFMSDAWRALAEDILAAVHAGVPFDTATVLSRLDDATAARITGRLLADPESDIDAQRVVEDCLVKLRKQDVERRRQLVLRAIRDAESRGNHAAVEEGLRELQALTQQDAHT